MYPPRELEILFRIIELVKKIEFSKEEIYDLSCDVKKIMIGFVIQSMITGHGIVYMLGEDSLWRFVF
jgi:hypothetical protein